MTKTKLEKKKRLELNTMYLSEICRFSAFQTNAY